MVSEDRRYRAEVFKICGFALMTPFGKIILQLLDIGLQIITLRFFVSLLISLFLFSFGVIMLQIGYESVQESN